VQINICSADGNIARVGTKTSTTHKHGNIFVVSVLCTRTNMNNEWLNKLEL